MNFCQEMKPIFTSLSPNTEKDDVWLAFKLLFQPWLWKESAKSSFQNIKLEEKFRKYLGVQYAFSFNSGRVGLMAILDALDVKGGDEVLLQAFTCNAAVNPILGRGARPVFIDIDNTINLDPEDLERKITKKSKAVIVQHTFGWPAKIEEILKIARRNHLFLIEDCAHSLGAKVKGKLCGTFGDAAFFSFGRDKIISSVYGGIAVSNNRIIGEKIKRFWEKISYPSSFWIFQQLLHPVLTNYLILPGYGMHPNLGRILLGGFHKLLLLSKSVHKKEKKGRIPDYFPKKLPLALAILALNQFKKLERFNEHRRRIANFYKEELADTGFVLPLSKTQKDILPVFMRYPILVNFDTDKFLEELQKYRVFLNDGWRKTPVVPSDTDLSKVKYTPGNCPSAEKMARDIINLPTHINISETAAKKIVNLLKRTLTHS